VGGADDGDSGGGVCWESFCEFGGLEHGVKVQADDVEARNGERDVGWVGACAEDQAGSFNLELFL